MKLLKLFCVLFLIYFVRRMIQGYKAIKKMQVEVAELQKNNNQTHPDKPVEAEFKVVD